MAQTLGNVPGKVNSSNALVVTGATSGTGTGTKGTLMMLPCKTDSSNRLVVIFV